MEKVGCALVFIILIILIASSVPIQNTRIPSWGASLTKGDEYAGHVPIKIEDNGDFDFAHGVIGGSGTYTDPYIIKGWKINANRTEYGILIENTSAYVVIEDCYIYNTSHRTGNNAGAGFWDFYDDGGIKLIRASNILIKNVVLKDGDLGIFINGGENIWIEKSRFDNYLLWASIYVNSSWWVTVEDNAFNLDSGGIIIRNSQYLTVEKNAFNRDGDDGISVKNVRYLRVSNNQILGDKKGYTTGIEVTSSRDVVLENNTIANVGTAIRVASSANSKILNNTMVNCSIVVGGSVSDISSYDLHGNTVNGRDVVFIKNRSNFTFSGETGEIILANVSNFKISHASVSRASWAIEIVHGNNGAVEFSELRHNLNPILVTSSENITVEGNTLEYGSQGITVSSSKFIVVKGNFIRHFESAGLSIGTSAFVWMRNNEIYNSGYAISIGDTCRFLNRDIYVLNNTCSANYYGLYLSDTSKVVVMHNNFNKNTESGISIDGTISNSKISENTCNDNGLYGIDVSGWLVDSKITNNTLIGNAEGLHIPNWATPENCTISGNRISNRMPLMFYYVLLGIGIVAILVVLFFVRHHRRKS